MPDESAARLEQPLLQACERPILDGDGQHQPTEQVAEIVGDDAEEPPDLVGPEPMARQSGPAGRRLALLDPPLRRPALVVEANDGPVRPDQRGDDEAHVGEEFVEVVLDLRAQGRRAGATHYGLIAEQVATVYPVLVTHTATGEVQTVKYHELIPMLLNELQRLQAKVTALEALLGSRLEK
jgi:hypothetical protein